MYLAVLASMVHGLTVPGAIEVAQRNKGYTKGLFEWIRKAPWGNPVFSGMFLSLVGDIGPKLMAQGGASPDIGALIAQSGQSLGSFGGVETYQALKFKEKPSEEQAREFIARGDHSWNSGMFIWRPKTNTTFTNMFEWV